MGALDEAYCEIYSTKIVYFFTVKFTVCSLIKLSVVSVERVGITAECGDGWKGKFQGAKMFILLLMLSTKKNYAYQMSPHRFTFPYHRIIRREIVAL